MRNQPAPVPSLYIPSPRLVLHFPFFSLGFLLPLLARVFCIIWKKKNLYINVLLCPFFALSKLHVLIGQNYGFGLPVASRTRARSKKEDSFSGCFTEVEPGRREGGSLGAKRRGRAPQRVSSVSGGLQGGGGDDRHEAIVITDSEDSGDKAISASRGGEEEEESSDYGPQTARRFEPNRFFHKRENTVTVDDVNNDCDEEDSTDFESDESVGGPKIGRFRGDKFLSRACSDDGFMPSGEEKVLSEKGEGNGGSFKSKNDDYGPNVSWKRTPLMSNDGPEADPSLDCLSSSESSTEADDSGDEEFLANVSESLSTDAETCSSSEEYVSESKREENLEIGKKRKCGDRRELSSLYSRRKTTKELDFECTDDPVIDDVGKEDVERRVSWVNEWLQNDVEEKEEVIDVDLDIECMDNPVIDDARRKENVDCRVSWVNEWLQGDDEEVKEKEVIDVERVNAEVNCPSNDENGNSGQMEERGSFSMLERRGMKEKEEIGCGVQNDDEGLQPNDDEQEEEAEAEIQFDGVNAGMDVSFVNENRKIRKMEERGNFYATEKEGLNQSQEKSTSQSKVSEWTEECRTKDMGSMYSHALILS